MGPAQGVQCSRALGLFLASLARGSGTASSSCGGGHSQQQLWGSSISIAAPSAGRGAALQAHLCFDTICKDRFRWSVEWLRNERIRSPKEPAGLPSEQLQRICMCLCLSSLKIPAVKKAMTQRSTSFAAPSPRQPPPQSQRAAPRPRPPAPAAPPPGWRAPRAGPPAALGSAARRPC